MLKYITFILVILSCCVCVVAEDAAVIDAAKTPVIANPWAVKYDYTAKNKRVVEVVEELAKKSGVDLRVGSNLNDFQVRDNKITIKAKNVYLINIMNSIARTLRLQWQKTDEDGKINYRLVKNKKLWQEAQDKLDALQKLLEAKRKSALSAFANLENLTPTEVDNLKETNPFLYLAASSGMAGAVNSFLDATPRAYNALIAGQALNLQSSNLSGAAQNGLLKAINSYNGILSQSGIRRSEESQIDASKMTIQINPHMEMAQSMPMGNLMLGEIMVQGGGADMMFPLIDPSSNIAKLTGKMMVEALSTGEPVKPSKDDGLAFAAAALGDSKQTETGDSKIEHTPDPALAKKVKFKSETDRMSDIALAFAEVAEYNITTDNPIAAGQMFFTNQAQEYDDTIIQIADKITNKFHSNWNKEGSFLEFTSRDWYKNVKSLIPFSQVEKWQREFVESGTLDINSLSEMSVLSTDQFNLNISKDDILLNDRLIMIMMSSKNQLSFYSTLSQEQIKMIFSNDGLPAAYLTESQINALLNILPRFNNDDMLSMYLKGERKIVGKAFDYVITMENSEDNPYTVLSLTTPVYTPKVVKENIENINMTQEEKLP